MPQLNEMDFPVKREENETLAETISSLECIVNETHLVLNRLNDELFLGISNIGCDGSIGPVPTPPREPSLAERLRDIRNRSSELLVLSGRINSKVRD